MQNIGNKIIRFDSIDSTNIYLSQLIRNLEIKEGTLVIAEEQTAGRGQIENTWESQKGMNLTFSFVLFPTFLPAREQFILSKFVSLALFDLLNGYIDNVKIKWPNDLYVGKKKIAGILIENVIKGSNISSSIIGIGLNINQKKFGKRLPFATSLLIESGIKYRVEVVLFELIEKLNQRHREFKSGDLGNLHLQYINALYQFNEYCDYNAYSKIFCARITGIENDGRLCLITKNDELLKFAFKEVHFL
jgi:BirA family transcriptional regulator, biotin operon repressor / biotin---[acetyl-CoA-carboxylase] ligase